LPFVVEAVAVVVLCVSVPLWPFWSFFE